MAANTDSETYELPTTDEYKEQTAEQTEIHLPVMGIHLPVIQVPPGQIMTSMEDMGLQGLLGDGDASIEKMIDEDGSIGLNNFMRTKIAPNILVEQTNKDAIHFDNAEYAEDDDVDDFDLSALKNEDLGALIKGMVTGDEDVDPEEQLEKFQG